MAKNSLFKLQVMVGEEARWVDAEKVFTHLFSQYNDKQDKSQNNLEKRMDKFINSLDNYKDDYGAEMIDEFIEYWTEPNKSGTKMRFEMEKAWSLGRRLSTWKRNGFGKKKAQPQSYKMDSTGRFYIAYCEKCKKSDFYEKPQYEESRCCNTKLLARR